MFTAPIFRRNDNHNPVLTPQAAPTFACPVRGTTVHWESNHVYNPAAVVRDGAVHLIYRAQDRYCPAHLAPDAIAGTSRLGLARSADGYRFAREAEPVLYPDQDALIDFERDGGCEDPRIVEDEDGTYWMTYTAFNTRRARLAVASSRDLRRWTKHGLAFGAADGGRLRKWWSKSGSIVCCEENGRLVATRIQGRYWMYWGESNIYAATSDNLRDWEPVFFNETPERVYSQSARPGEVAHKDTALWPILPVRPGRFDSGLVEPGPPAVLTPYGILFIYNSANARTGGDPSLPQWSYQPGWALLDPLAPTAVIARATAPLFVAEREFERNGLIPNVCFAEGLVRFGDRWLLYYGTADSRIAVAETDSLTGD